MDETTLMQTNLPSQAQENVFQSLRNLLPATRNSNCWFRQTLLFVLLLSSLLASAWADELPSVGAMRASNLGLSRDAALVAIDLWVDGSAGSDANDGLTPGAAFVTIQKAASLAGPGATVHIKPGVYRETVRPAASGSAIAPIRYVAENGPGTVIIRGSLPSTLLTWTQLTANTIGLPPGVDPAGIYYADLSAWGLAATPRFVAQLDGAGNVVARLPLARAPNWQVVTEWKYHEFWWAADGGWDVSGCTPPTDPDPANCDRSWRSATQLTDRTNDSEPLGIEPGNLTTLGDLTGATLVAMDDIQGHYAFRRTITAHDIAAGRVTVSPPAMQNEPRLGWGTKYYVEGKPNLLDQLGEWWYDTSSHRLYLWPPMPGNPAALNIEISWRDNGFDLSNRSYITLDGLTIELYNQTAIRQVNYETDKSYGNIIRNTVLHYANRGVWVSQSVQANSPVGNITNGFTLENSEVAYIDTHAIQLGSWWENNAAADSFTRSGVVNTVIRNNVMHHLGFRSDDDDAVGSVFEFADKLRFEGNYVHHVAHNGVQFSRSVIQSPKQYGFSPEEIKTGEILVKDNIFEKACQLTADCGALKFWGDPPDNHVFRDVLITGNVFRDTFGWTFVSEKRGHWTYGSVHGMGGFGLYVDMASGIHAYRNIAYNDAHNGFRVVGVWRDGDFVCYNNIAANSLYGFYLGGFNYATHDSVNTQIVNNIIVNNEAYGIVQEDAHDLYTNTTFDHNLYYRNGWGSNIWKPGDMGIYRGALANQYYPTLVDIQQNIPWEDRGMEGDPVFWSYRPDDHDRYDGSWPDFHLTSASDRAIDRGTADLPTSLQTLLVKFGVRDFRGSALDIGRYESGFAVVAEPQGRAIDPGGVAQYILRLYPPDLPHVVTLTTASHPPGLAVSLNPILIIPPGQAVLTVADGNTGTLAVGLWYTVLITGTGGGFTQTSNVGLLVGGIRVYLPVILKDAWAR